MSPILMALLGTMFARLVRQGHSIEETARITDHPVAFVRAAVEDQP